MVRCRVEVQQHHGALPVGRLRRPPQAISPEHHPLTGTPPSPAGQRRRITAASVVPRDRAMGVEQADRDEGPMACAAVRCAGSRPDGTAPAAGVRTMRCGETTRARTSRIAIGRSPAAARTRQRPRLEIQRFLVDGHCGTSLTSPEHYPRVNRADRSDTPMHHADRRHRRGVDRCAEKADHKPMWCLACFSSPRTRQITW